MSLHERITKLTAIFEKLQYNSTIETATGREAEMETWNEAMRYVTVRLREALASESSREAAAPGNLNVTELRDMLEAACVLAEIDEVPAKVTVLWWRAALRGEAAPSKSVEKRELAESTAALIAVDIAAGDNTPFPAVNEAVEKRLAAQQAGKGKE